MLISDIRERKTAGEDEQRSALCPDARNKLSELVIGDPAIIGFILTLLEDFEAIQDHEVAASAAEAGGDIVKISFFRWRSFANELDERCEEIVRITIRVKAVEENAAKCAVLPAEAFLDPLSHQ